MRLFKTQRRLRRVYIKKGFGRDDHKTQAQKKTPVALPDLTQNF